MDSVLPVLQALKEIDGTQARLGPADAWRHIEDAVETILCPCLDGVLLVIEHRRGLSTPVGY